MGSVLGLTLNLFLLLGALNRVAWPVVLWLVAYTFAVFGCILLFGVMLDKLIVSSDFYFSFISKRELCHFCHFVLNKNILCSMTCGGN